jgi:FtsZ-interacting cell division protein ZipA
MLIAPIAVGSVLVAVLVFVGVYCIVRRRHRGNMAQSAVPTEMHSARADSQRALSNADDPGAHYGIVSVAKPSSHYLEHAGDFKVPQSEPHHYAALSAAEAGEREPHYAVPTTPPVSAASTEPESPYDVLSDEEAGRATGTLRSPL